jgi:hypothetical protein
MNSTSCDTRPLSNIGHVLSGLTRIFDTVGKPIYLSSLEDARIRNERESEQALETQEKKDDLATAT